jgi:uncharacterized damage-inducible protein DinB
VTDSILADAFEHHVWASTRLIDACLELSPEQLETSVPGTYGTILETVRHLVGSDAWYLYRLFDDRSYVTDEDHMDLAELRAAIERNGTAWARLLAKGPDPDEICLGENDDGSVTKTTVGIRLAQALHHGTDHRSQICTAITTLGIEPPGIDVWAFGEQNGRVEEIPPPSS